MATRVKLLRRNLLTFPGGQPGFDPTHVASLGVFPRKGLSAIALPSGSFFNILTGGHSAPVAGGSPLMDGVMGPGVNFPSGGTTFQTIGGNASTGVPTQITMAAILRFTSVSATQQFFGNSSSASAAAELALTSSAFGVWFASFISSGIAPVAGVPYFYAMSYNTAAMKFVVLNLQTGKLQTATTASAVAISAFNGTYTIGNAATNTGTPAIANISAVMASYTDIGMAGLLQWAKDPWSFWYPQTLDIYDTIGTPPAAAAGSILQSIYDPPILRRVTVVDPTQPLNLNLFTNPIPILATDRLPAIRVPKVLPQPPDPLNINLFTNQFPFNQYDWNKPYFPIIRPYPQDGINNNLFTNPYPFNQYDWLKPYFPKVLRNPQDGTNPNLFTNPFPFNQIDWSKPFFPKVPPYPQDGINNNLFTNPIPILNIDASRAYSLRGASWPDQAYNQNLYAVVVVTAAPFNQTDWSIPIRQRPLPQPDQIFNPNLFTNPFPFNQTDFQPVHKLPQAPFDLSFATNLNIFTNPIPIYNVDYTPQHKPLPVPLDPNQGFSPLYQPVVTVTLLQRTLTGVGL